MRTSAFDFTVLNLPTALIRQGSAPARASIDPLEGRNLSGTDRPRFSTSPGTGTTDRDCTPFYTARGQFASAGAIYRCRFYSGCIGSRHALHL